MKIIHPKDALHVSKPEGTNVTYFLFPEYEIHANEQVPNSTQTWHHHEKIWETLYIIEGELVARWREGGIEKIEVVKAGDLIESENTPHTFENATDQVVKFLVIKQILSGQDKRDVLKNDKVIDK
jgi:uncharacterized cupin superfamily protein